MSSPRAPFALSSSLLLLACVACGTTDAPPPPPEVEVRFVVRADGAPPAYGDAPFPTDALRTETGRLEHIAGLESVVARHTDLLVEHLATLDGFGLQTTIEIFLTGAIDPASLDGAASVIDIDPSSPARGEPIPMDWIFDADRNVIAGSPQEGVILREQSRYAALLTTSVRDTLGRPIHVPEALATLRADPAAAPARWRSTADALAALTDEQAETLAAIAVFTTESATAPLFRARAVLEDPAVAPLPVLAFPDPAIVFDEPDELDRLLGVATRDAAGQELYGWSNPTGMAHDHVGVVATGTITTTLFQRPDTGTDAPDDETFDVDPATGIPRIDRIEAIPITFVLPADPPPTRAGYPVAIFAHGLGASRHPVLTFAEPLTRAGFALVAIDMAGHGSRFDPTDETNGLAAVMPEFSGDPMLRDGFPDRTGVLATAAFFEGFLNMSAVRDSVRQSVIDLCNVVRLLKSGDVDLSPIGGPHGSAPRLDTSKLAFLGESFGAHVGAVFTAVEPDVDLFVLDVPGGGILAREIPNAPVLSALVFPLARGVYGFTGQLSRFQPLGYLGQSIIDGADPLAYAPHVLRDRADLGTRVVGPRHVVILEVAGDELVPNKATGGLARALGAQILTPWIVPTPGVSDVASPASANVDGQTAVVVQYSPATHGANWTTQTGTLTYVPGFPHDGEDPFPRLAEPVEIRNPLYETLQQVEEILTTHLTDAAPVVRMIVPPVADFDGDGVTDEDEIAQGRDPYRPGV